MFKISIEKEVSFDGTESYTLEQGGKSSPVTHEQKSGNPVTKKISRTDYRLIAEAFAALDFSKIFRESGEAIGCDGWTLRCTLRNGLSELSVSLWCPSKDESKPETTKLLEACEKVYDIFD